MNVEFGDDTVILLKREPTGSYDGGGNAIYTDAPTPLGGVSVQPLTSTEKTGNQDFIAGHWRMLGPVGMGLAPNDHLTWNGLDLQVDGDAMEWRTDIGPDYTDVHLVLWTG